MAKIFLGSNEIFTVGANSTADVYGLTGGTEKVIATAGAVVNADQNVERVELSGASSSYTYAVSGNVIKVLSGTTTVATIGAGANAQTIAFADGSAALALTGLNTATLGGQAISATATGAALSNVTLDAADKSASASSSAPVAGTYTIAASATSVTEGSAVTFTVTAGTAPTVATTLNYQIVGSAVGTTVAAATAADFSAINGSVTIAAGATTGTFTVTPLSDSLVEGFEGFKVSLVDSAYSTVATSSNVVIGDNTSPASIGSNFILTVDADNFTGTPGNDTFSANADGLLTTGDSLNGGAGSDTLSSRHTITADTSISPGTTDIEVLKVRLDHDGGAADAVTYSLADVVGATEVQSFRSVNSGTTADAVLTFSGAGLNTGVTLAIVGGDTGADDSSIDVTAVYQAVTGGSDSATLRLDGAAANVVTIADIETLNITTSKSETSASSTGASALNSLAASSASKVNISGTGALTLKATNFASTVTVDASASTGAVTYTPETSTAQTFIGGTGADKVKIGALSELTASDRLNGGAGIDTIATTSTSVSSGNQALLASQLTNFEKLEFYGTSSVTVNLTDLAVFDTVVFSGITTAAAGTGATAESAGATGTDAHTINGIDTGDAIIISAAITGGAGESLANVTSEVDAGNGANALTLTPNLDNGANSVTITLSANITGGDGGTYSGTNGITAASGGDGGVAISAATFETVTLITSGTESSLAIAGGAGGVGAVSGTASDNGVAGSSVVVNTNGKIIVEGAIDLDLGTIAGTNATIDASAFTGKLTVTGEAGSNTFIGGSNNDILNGALGLDTYTLGSGADRVVIGLGATTTPSDAPAASTGTTPNTSYESITDFNISVDVLDFLTATNTALTETIVTNATAITGTAAINSKGIASFALADDTLAERITAVEAGINAGGSATAGQLAVFEFGSSTFVFVSDGTDNLAVGDLLVKLTGVTNITSTTFDDNGYLVLG